MAAANSNKKRKRRTTTQKKTTRSRTSGRTTKKAAAAGNDSIAEEIAVCLLFAISILMVIGNFGIGGRIGNGFSDIMFGIFGLTQYVFPFVLFFGAAFYIANRTNGLIGRKIVGIILLLVFSSAFLELLIQGYSRGTQLMTFYTISSEDHTGGGIIGGAVVTVFAFAFGTFGAYVLIIAGLIIGSIVLTQKPILKSLTQRGTKAARIAREKHQIRREMRALEKEKLAAEEAEEREEIRSTYMEELTAREAASKNKEQKKQIRLPKIPFVDLRAEADDEGEPLVKKTAFAPKLTEETTNVETGEIEAASQDASLNGVFADQETLDPSSDTASEAMASGTSGSGFTMPGFLSATLHKEEKTADPVDFERREVVSDGAQALMAEAEENSAAEEKEPTVKRARKTKASQEEQAKAADLIQLEINDQEELDGVYQLPSLDLLTKGSGNENGIDTSLNETAVQLEETLKSFGVELSEPITYTQGPTVTRFELKPKQGVKVSRIVNLQDDIKLNLAASEIRIEAPIPGKSAIGIEVPNKKPAPVLLGDMLSTTEFQNSKATIPFAVGKDIAGKPVIADIEKMPHILIAGATGSGKSVCINTLIMSILYKAKPEDVKMIMIDPKVVEMKIYDGIPHLLIPVVTDPKKAAGALNWAVQEMTDRYNKFASHPGIRDIKGYNKFVQEHNRNLPEGEAALEKMPRIVVIVDELADLMMVAAGAVEDAICRLAQLARAAGIHLIIATQRPSVNVVTGLIKANMPSRIALSVTSGVDSRTILDMNGAEKLLGHGDMLFYPQNYAKPARLQGDFVSDGDITKVVEFLTANSGEVMYNKEVEEQIANSSTQTTSPSASSSDEGSEDNARDEYFADAGRLIIEKEKASIGMLQRAFKIGFNRAARIMDQLADVGVVGQEEGTKPRKILVTKEEFEQILSNL